MGVQGLWQLLQPTGRPVTLESLEGKILAIDVSVWLHQSMKGMRDQHGNAVHNAHLHVLFNRVCKLLFYRIRPVFVFDGGVPELKKNTLAKRRQRRVEANVTSDKVTQKLMTNLLKNHAVNTMLGKQRSGHLSRSNNNTQPDMFALNPLPETERPEPTETDEWEDMVSQRRQIYDEFEELEAIDVEGDDFKAMPAEIQHEILTELKARQKENSWAKLDTLPEESTDFSKYQLSKLMKSSKLSQRLDDVRKELNTRTVGSIGSELMKDKSYGDVETRRVVSEETTHYILIRGLKNAASKLSQNEPTPNDDELKDESNSATVKLSDEKLGSLSKDSDSQKIVEPNVDLNAEMDSADILSKCKEMMREKRKEIIKDAEESSLNSKSVDSKMADTVTVADEKSADLNYSLPVSAEHDLEIKSPYFSPNPSQESILFPLSPAKEIESKQTDHVIQLPDVSIRQSEACEQQSRDIPDLIKDITMSKEPSEISGESSPGRKSCDDNHEQTVIDKQISDIEPRSIAKQTTSNLVTLGHTSHVVAAEAVTPVLVAKEPTSEVTDIKPERRHSDGNDVVMIDSDSSDEEDNDFIEVSINTSDVRPHDDLFPASIFQTNVTSPLTEVNKSQMTSTPSSHVANSGEAITVAAEQMTVIQDDDWAGDLPDQYEAITDADLSEVQMALAAEGVTLTAERGKQERLGASITEQVHTEAQELLKLFGVPYIVAPTEAEAQCAYLELTNQTHGTITEDSDIWLFGGKNVYKNFFNQSKHVELFKDSDIEKNLMLERESLIRLAYLCGSDYTEGIQGVGPVTGLELLTEFPGTKLQGLQNMADWWKKAKAKTGLPETETKVKAKLRSLTLNSGFPNPTVYDAYLRPPVDESREKFTWARPELDLLRDFSSDKMAWSKQKADDMLLPMLKKINEQQAQTHITSFFQQGEFNIPPRKVKSDRVNRILKRMRGEETESRSPSPKGKVTPGIKVKSSKRSTKLVSNSKSSSQKSSVGDKADTNKSAKNSSKVNVRVKTGARFVPTSAREEDIQLSENSSESEEVGDVTEIPFGIQEIMKLASQSNAYSSDNLAKNSTSAQPREHDKKCKQKTDKRYLGTKRKADDNVKSKNSTKRKSKETYGVREKKRRGIVNKVGVVESVVILSSESD